LVTILDQWRQRATLQIIDRIERSDESASVRFHRLMCLPFGSSRRSRKGADVELSIRLWGRRDNRARAALAEIDLLRLKYLQRLLVAAGIAEAVAEVRAIQAYSFMRVAPSLLASGREDMVQQISDDLLSRDAPAP